MPSRILVIEDTPHWYDIFERILKDMGCAVDIAENRDQANAFLIKSRYDLVLLDIMMSYILDALKRSLISAGARCHWVRAILTFRFRSSSQNRRNARGSMLSSPLRASGYCSKVRLMEWTSSRSPASTLIPFPHNRRAVGAPRRSIPSSITSS